MPLANSEIYQGIVKVKRLSPPLRAFSHTVDAYCVLSSLIGTENVAVNWTDKTLDIMEL